MNDRSTTAAKTPKYEVVRSDTETASLSGDPGPPAPALGVGDTTEWDVDDFAFPQKRRWPYVLLGAALGIGGTFAVANLLKEDTSDQQSEVVLEIDLATAPVEIRDLIEEVEWVADLGYGPPVEVALTLEGTVTETPEVGTILGRGDALLHVNDDPVILLYGQIPAWRDLAEDDEGPDVEQLEVNLVVLGFDPDGLVTIDGTYTGETALMVQRWQESLDVDVTGEFVMSQVVVVAGPVVVTGAAEVGRRADTQLVSLSVRADLTTVVGQQTGEISAIADIGEEIVHGSILYVADGVEVMALITVDSIAGFLLDADSDPVNLEGALVFAGFDPQRSIVIDGDYDLATVAAIARWQQASGLTVTGEMTSEAYLLVAAGQHVSSRLLHRGDAITAARPVLELSTATLSVVIPVGLTDQDDFGVGQAVSVALSDESVVTGVIVEVGTIAQAASPDQAPTIDVTVELTGLIDNDFPASQVTVTVAGESVLNALVVPTRALVTLSEGGFAVEKVLGDGTTVLIGVETGTFDDGVVEVESSQLQAGDQLVVPQ